MPWTPEIKVFDSRAARSNLLAYITTNQTDVLTWAAADDALLPLSSFKLLALSPRITTVLPAFTILESGHQTDFGDGGILGIDLAMRFEVIVAHGKQDTLAKMVPKYVMAVESILANVPKTTFLQGSIINTTMTMANLETTMDIQGKFNNSQFAQVFVTTAQWRIEASVY